jgi:hypothetical protein
MLLVVAFLMLFLSLMAIAYSQLGALVRTETHRVQMLQLDQGPTAALASALALLETGYPLSTPYECSTVLDTPAGPQTYAVTFTLEQDGSWIVSAAPSALGAELPPMPVAFTATMPPPM